MRDHARVAELSAHEAFRLLQSQYRQDGEALWSRFDTLLNKRVAEIEHRHKDELHALTARTKELESVVRTAEQQKAHEIQHANRRVEDSLREAAELRERNHELEAEMAKVCRIGKREEISFEEEVRTWAGIAISEKLPKYGDFVMAYRSANGVSQEPRMLLDCKDKATICEADITKLLRDSKQRETAVAILVARNESQLRQIDKECRWDRSDGVWVLRTCRQWLPRDLDMLKSLFERMRAEGSDFLDKNAALADEVRRTFADLDRIEGELKKAAKAITSASGLVTKYKGRLQLLCDGTTEKIPSQRQPINGGVSQSVGA